MVKKLMFRLLPVQIILAAAGTINMIVSSFFASNCVGQNAMSAVGLYGPLNMFFGAISLMLVGGSSILCGEYLGQNHQEKLRGVYTLDVIVSALLGLLFTAIILALAVFDLTGFFTSDAAVRPLFNQYLIQQSVRLFPVRRKQRAHYADRGSRFHISESRAQLPVRSQDEHGSSGAIARFINRNVGIPCNRSMVFRVGKIAA